MVQEEAWTKCHPHKIWFFIFHHFHDFRFRKLKFPNKFWLIRKSMIFRKLKQKQIKLKTNELVLLFNYCIFEFWIGMGFCLIWFSFFSSRIDVFCSFAIKMSAKRILEFKWNLNIAIKSTRNNKNFVSVFSLWFPKTKQMVTWAPRSVERVEVMKNRIIANMEHEAVQLHRLLMRNWGKYANQNNFNWWKF